MNRFRLAHILLCAWICFFLGAAQGATQDYSEARVLPTPYQEWLDEDVLYLITEEERAEFEKLVTSQERDSSSAISGRAAIQIPGYQKTSSRKSVTAGSLMSTSILPPKSPDTRPTAAASTYSTAGPMSSNIVLRILIFPPTFH